MTARKRVLMVGPGPEMKGGIASVVKTYLDSGYADRFDVRHHATTLEGGWLRRALKSAVALAAFPAVVTAFRPDLVHIHHASGTSFYRKLLFLLLSRALRLRTVVHCHGARFADFHDASRLNAALIRLFMDRSDACLALSEGWRQVLAGYTRNPRIHVVHNPVDTAEFATSREAAVAPGGTRTILCLGRLGQRKGTYDLLEAVPLVLRSVPEARFVLGGDGELEEVERRLRRHGLREVVRTVGWVTGIDKVRLVTSCDVYVLPSYREGVPVSILEAMAAAKPVVTTPVGGIPEVVEDGVNGYLVQPGDVTALASRIVALLEDPALRQEMGRRNQARVQATSSLATVVEQLASVYDSVTAERATR